MIDGHGILKPKIIDQCLKLSNVVLIHFNKVDLHNPTECNVLMEELKKIAALKHKPKVFLLVRDSIDTGRISQSKKKAASSLIDDSDDEAPVNLWEFDKLEQSEVEKLCEDIIFLPNMKMMNEKEDRLDSIKDLIYVIEDCKD